MDEQLRLRSSLPDQALTYWDPGFGLALGNELVWGRPWLGEITTAQLRTPFRSVDLLTPDVVERPGVLELFERRIKFGTTNLGALFLNLFGFVPIGALSVWCWSRPKVGVIVAIWFIVSLTGESSQIFVAARFPTISDLFLNSLGVLLGAAIGIRARAMMVRREVVREA